MGKENTQRVLFGRRAESAVLLQSVCNATAVNIVCLMCDMKYVLCTMVGNVSVLIDKLKESPLPSAGVKLGLSPRAQT